MNKKPQNNIILYQDENGLTNVSVRFTDENLWLTQKQIAEIYDTSRPNITMHIKNILNEGELDELSVCKDFLLTAADGKNYKTMHYCLDMMLQGSGRISHQEAIEKAEEEFAIYREREMKQLESDFDRAVKEFAKLDKAKNDDKEAE